MTTSHQSAKFKSGDVEIAYRLFGSPGATPLLIVHGLSFFSYDWIGPASALAEGRQVAAMDMRGFGDSGWSKDYSIGAFAGDIIALLDHLGWKEVILVGHSMGGRNSCFCAAENPGRIRALVLVDWSPEPAAAGSKRTSQTVAGTPDTFATVDEAMQHFGSSNRQRFEAYLKPVSGGFALKRDLHFANQFRRMLQTGERPALGVDLWAVLARVSCPTLVIRGARSDLFATETAPKMLAANARFELTELDTGHNVAGDDPQGLVGKVKAFLSSQGG